MSDKAQYFAVQPADPSEVSSALNAAETCWQRGDRPEALRALRQAVEAASDAELDGRALELAKLAADLATHIGSMSARPPPVAPSVVPPPAPSRPSAVPQAKGSGPSVVPPAKGSGPSVVPPTKGSGPSVVPPARSSGSSVIPPRPAQVASRPSPARTAGPTPLRAAAATEEPRKAERKSLAGEVSRGRAPSAHEDMTTPVRVPHVTHDVPSARKKSNSRGDRAKRPSRTDEIDAWPTEALKAQDLPAGLDGTTAPPVRATQAARVMVWRDADGSVRMTPAGAPAPADAIEAMLAAFDPDADLLALLRERS